MLGGDEEAGSGGAGTQCYHRCLSRWLMDLEYAEEVEIDVCLNCNGAWLDLGGLESLKEKSDAGDTGDKGVKAVEEWEEMMAKRRSNGLNSLFGRLMR
jgi:Zn-finger nucleic acid-binding protein